MKAPSGTMERSGQFFALIFPFLSKRWVVFRPFLILVVGDQFKSLKAINYVPFEINLLHTVES